MKNFPKPKNKEALNNINVIALIPAKLTSRRIERKNIKLLGQHPLFEFSIRAASHCKNINGIYVSSESQDLLKHAKELGSSVIQRPDHLSRAEITNKEVIQHAVTYIEDKENHKIDYLVLMQPTHPFRQPEEIDSALEVIKQNPMIDTLVTVTKHENIRGAIADESFIPEMGTFKKRRNLYQITGSFYIFKCDTTIKRDKLYGNWVYPFVIKNSNLEIDIDEPKDFDLAKVLFELNKNLFNFLNN